MRGIKLTLSLTYTMLKGNGLANISGDSRKKSKWVSKAGNVILMGLLAVYMSVLTGVSALTLRRLLEPAGLHHIIIGLYISLAAMLIFFFGIVYVISIFYHSSDTEKLLPLPIRADTIISAKLILTALYEYVFVIVLIVPPLLVYGLAGSEPWYYFLSAAFVVLLLPVIPLCAASVIVMLIMRFTPFARDKDRFSMVSGLLAMGLALVFVFMTQTFSSYSQEDLRQLLQSGIQDLSDLTSILFPGISTATAALTAVSASSALSQLALLAVLSIMAITVTLITAKGVYYKGVIGLTASASKQMTLSDAALREQTRPGSAFAALLKKDVLILVRTPVFFMNNVLMNFLWPAFFLVPFITSSGDIGAYRTFLDSVDYSLFSHYGTIFLAIAFAVACFLSGANGIAQSALSREGRRIYVMKIIPVPYKLQILAKITTGFLFSMCGILIMYILIILTIKPDILFGLVLLLVLPGAAILTNTAGILFDLIWPKLHWDNEQKAVKQNMNVLYGMLAAMVFAAVALVVSFAFRPPFIYSAAGLILIPWLAAFALWKLIKWMGPRQMKLLDI